MPSEDGGNIVAASIRAIVSGVNRLHAAGSEVARTLAAEVSSRQGAAGRD